MEFFSLEALWDDVFSDFPSSILEFQREFDGRETPQNISKWIVVVE